MEDTMKVILKGGSEKANISIQDFFLKNILPILGSEIAIEETGRTIVVHRKRGEGRVPDQFDDPTAEVIVELSMEAILLALDPKTPREVLVAAAGDFLDEAEAIRWLVTHALPFSVEFYTCAYLRGGEAAVSKTPCDMCGSTEHLTASDGCCPGCGRKLGA